MWILDCIAKRWSHPWQRFHAVVGRCFLVIGLSDKLSAMRKTTINCLRLKSRCNSSRCFITQGPSIHVANHARWTTRTWVGWLSPDGCKWSWEPSSVLGLGGPDDLKDRYFGLRFSAQWFLIKKSKPTNQHVNVNLLGFLMSLLRCTRQAFETRFKHVYRCIPDQIEKFSEMKCF